MEYQLLECCLFNGISITGVLPDDIEIDNSESSRNLEYRIAGNIGGELYLADWRISCHTANIKSANIAPIA